MFKKKREKKWYCDKSISTIDDNNSNNHNKKKRKIYRKTHPFYIGKWTESKNINVCVCVYTWMAKILAFVSECEWKWNENRIKSFLFSHSFILSSSFLLYFVFTSCAHCSEPLNIFFPSEENLWTHTHTLKFSLCMFNVVYFF